MAAPSKYAGLLSPIALAKVITCPASIGNRFTAIYTFLSVWRNFHFKLLIPYAVRQGINNSFRGCSTYEARVLFFYNVSSDGLELFRSIARSSQEKLSIYMARPIRIEFPGANYHITSRSNSGKKIFLANEDRVIFLNILNNVVQRFSWRLHSYVMMDDHFHLVVETPQGQLSRGMRQLNGVYTPVSYTHLTLPPSREV